MCQQNENNLSQQMPQSLGKKIKQFREQQEVTQSKLAEELSVTRQAVSNWERDKTLPDVYMLQQIAAYFGMGLDQFMEGTKEAEITMPKTPGILAAASGGAFLCYLAAGGFAGRLYVETIVMMVIIWIFVQLFLHLYFSSSVKTGNFSMLAGYDNKVEYNVREVKKALIQMDLHIGCVSFGFVLLFGICAFLAGSQMDGVFSILAIAYCIDITAALMLYNYRSIDKTLVKEQDQKIAKAGFLSDIWFVAWIYIFILGIFVKFTIYSIENNSREALGNLGWIFLFLAITVAELFYEQHRVKKQIEAYGEYKPGVAFWASTAAACVVVACLFLFP